MPDHVPDRQPAIVRLRARDVLASLTTTVHAARIAAAEDLHERLNLVDGGRETTLSTSQRVEPATIGLRDGGHVLRLLLAPLDLKAADPELSELLEMIVRGEILGRDQIPAVERRTGCLVRKRVILATRLRARTAIR